jgi:hypothetical protein
MVAVAVPVILSVLAKDLGSRRCFAAPDPSPEYRLTMTVWRTNVT